MTLAETVPLLAPHHLGSLHAYETALVLLLAFGPFVVIVGLVVRDRRRAADQEDVREPAERSVPDTRSASGP